MSKLQGAISQIEDAIEPDVVTDETSRVIENMLFDALYALKDISEMHADSGTLKKRALKAIDLIVEESKRQLTNLRPDS